MANDPKSRLTEGNLNSPAYTAPNGITEQRGNAGGMASGISGSDVGRRDDETAGEKIGRFFKRAMERLSGRGDDWERRRDEVRNERDADQFSYRTGGWQPYRGGSSGGSPYSQGQGSSGEASSYGEGSSYGQGSYAGQGSYESDPTRFGATASARGAYGQSFGSSGQGSYAQPGPSFDNRGSLGQRGLGRSP